MNHCLRQGGPSAAPRQDRSPILGQVTPRRLKAIYLVQGVAFGLLMPFPVPLLAERGLGPAEIGLILSVSGVAALLAYPVWGTIADGWLGRPRTIVLTALTAAAGGVWIMLAGSDPATLTLALSLALVGVLAWGPLIDALTLGELAERSTSYGRIRVWASAGWAASATFGGWLWMQAGPEPVFTAFVIGALSLALLVCCRYRCRYRPRPEPPPAQAPVRTPGSAPWPSGKARCGRRCAAGCRCS